MTNKLEYIPFHKNVAQLLNVGELEMTPEGIGCKINDYLVVLYYRCESPEEMTQIKEKGFEKKQTEFGEGVLMYRKYEDAVKDNCNHIIFTRVTRGNHVEGTKEEVMTMNKENIDLFTIVDGNQIIGDLVLNTVNIEIIAFIDFEN